MSLMSAISVGPNFRRLEVRELMGEERYSEIVGRLVADVEKLNRKLDMLKLPDLYEIVADCHNVCDAAYMIGHDECVGSFASIERAAKAGDMVATFKLIAELRASRRSMTERVSRALHFVH